MTLFNHAGLKGTILLLALVWCIPMMGQQDTFTKKDLDTLFVGDSKSGYDDLDIPGGAKSVNADLRSDDVYKPAWSRKNFAKKLLNGYYDAKRFLKKRINLSVGTDYMFLNQWSTFSFSDNQASSGIFRLFGNWTRPGERIRYFKGSFIFKIENRHIISGGVLPRNLGYEAGAALSTASFKDFGWGLTNFYWKQQIGYGDYILILGIMDPGDWLDLYPLLNPYKYFLNEAFFNSPAMALPNQGLGAVFGVKRLFETNFYLIGGIHDANGQPEKFIVDNFKSFFQSREYMYWVELGWAPQPSSIIEGESVHFMYWYQAPRRAEVAEGEEVERSWGVTFSASREFRLGDYTAFFRAGISEGNGATMRHLIMTGFGMKVINHDYFALGLHWGAPSDRSAGNQFGLEAFYAFQLTDNLNIAPDIQLTFNPSFNDEKKVVGVFSVFRVRMAL